MLRVTKANTKFCQNAFGALDEHHFDMFTVDILHEVPLGVFRSTFTYLVGILNCYSGDLVGMLNKRCVMSRL